MKGATPSTISSWALMIAHALEEQGVDGPDLFRRAGLDPALLADPTARYSVTGLQSLWRYAVEATGDPAFGFAVARQWHPTSFNGLGYAWLASPTLGDAFRRLERYFRVITQSGWMAFRRAGGGYVFTLEPALTPDARPALAAMDAAMLTFVIMCRWIVGKRFSPVHVQLVRAPPNDTGRYEEAFGAPVVFGQLVDGMMLTHDDVERQLPHENRALALAAEEVMDRYLAQTDVHQLSSRVRAAIAESLPAADVSQERVARSLNLSVRTLQRRLAEEDTSFRALLEQTRRELALRYVVSGTMSLGEIAFMLGFSEPSNLTRAFRRWTGLSPTAWREQAMEGDD